MTIGAVRMPGVSGPHVLESATTQGVIGGVGYAFAFATFLGLGDSEILLQAWWVTNAVGAFVHGLRIAASRIVVSAIVAVGYSWIASSLGLLPDMDGFDFTEWPLMVAISLTVATMADMVATSANRYATLYRNASDRLHTAHEDERARLARDLHDGVGQTLTAVVLTLDAVEAALEAGPSASPRVTASVRRAQVLAASALAEARDVAGRLRPQRIHEVGLGAALRSLADSAGVPVDFRLNADVLPAGVLGVEREIDAYRIVQEAIGNAARHSGASRIWIGSELAEDGIRIEVGDDGVGFDDSAHELGLGLNGMAERASLLNARLQIVSRPGDGTTVTLTIPWPKTTGPLPSAAPVAPGAH